MTATTDAESDEALALARCLSARTRHLCRGLDAGAARLLDLVTPTTAKLLRWWFGANACAARRLNFHYGQRQAILNLIVAHEVLGPSTLPELYWRAAPDALLSGGRLAEISRHRDVYPKYCLSMSSGTGKTWVLQALLIWQLLNKTAALAQGYDDARFIRHFLIVAAGGAMHRRLRAALHGVRDFRSADLVRCAELFVPHAYRDQVFSFVRGDAGQGMLAIIDRHLLSQPSLPDFLAELPELIAFNYQIPQIHPGTDTARTRWQKNLSRIAAPKGRRFLQIDFCASPWIEVGAGDNRRRQYFPHIVAKA
jgi:type III restriction enzyme